MTVPTLRLKFNPGTPQLKVKVSPAIPPKEAEFRVSGGYIQWRVGSDGTWANLVALSSLQILTDGDYGDIVVSSSGLSWAIDSSVLSAFGRTLIDDGDASAALSTLGVSAYIKTLLDDTSASVARATLGVVGVGEAPAVVTSRTALKSLATSTYKIATLSESGRSGTFLFTYGDYSAAVTEDTLEGITIKADDTASSAGAWVRLYASEVNVLWWGADPTYTSDSAPAIKAARDYLESNSDYRGGTMRIPAGRYKVNSTIAFTSYDLVHNIWIKGDGPIATTLDFSGATAGTNGITFGVGAHFGVSDLMITGARNDAISINPTLSPGDPSYALHFTLNNLRLQQSVRHGLRLVNAYMGQITRIWSTSNTGYGFVLAGFHTSLHCADSFASSNGGAGWSVNGVCYSSFINCASDQNTWGYAISNVSGVSFVNCGAESNLRDAFFLFSSNASATGIPSVVQDITALSLIDCFAIGNCTSAALSYGAMVNASTANGRGISYKVSGGRSAVNSAGDGAFVNQGASGTVTAYVDNHVTDGVIFDSGSVVHLDRFPAVANTQNLHMLYGGI